MSTTTTECHSTHCKSCPAWRGSAFANLTPADLDLLQKHKSESLYNRGDTFSVKGEPAEEVYCLASGSAKVTMFDAQSGRQSLVRLVAPGEMLGYRCIFSNKKFRGTATALTPSIACKINKNFIFGLITKTPDFSFELLKRMGREVESAEYHHHSFCQKNVRERLAEALLILKQKFGRDTALGCKIDTRLTRNELSNWVGASRETVIRELTNFAQESLILQDGEFTYLLNIQKLAQISGTELPPAPTPPLTHATPI